MTTRGAMKVLRRLYLPRGIASLGTALLDQQLWCWGRDILAARGNLLIDYGVERIPAPAGCEAGSLYVVRPDRRTNLALRGYGVFCGSRGEGGIFVKRFSFRPLLTARHLYPRNAFEFEQIPPVSSPATRKSWKTALKLLALLCRECSAYEEFILADYGRGYRSATLVKWRSLKANVIPSHEMAPLWNQLAERIRRESER